MSGGVAEWLDRGRSHVVGASSAPWEVYSVEFRDRVSHSVKAEAGRVVAHTGYEPGSGAAYGDAAFIADARTRLPQALDALTAVTDLHQPGTWVYSHTQGLRFEPLCPDCRGAAGVHDCGCWAEVDQKPKCATCADSAWPCETVRAVMGALGIEEEK